MVVKQGLALLEALIDTKAALQKLILYPSDCEDNVSLCASLTYMGCVHPYVINSWLLEKLVEWKEPWVLSLERLSLRNHQLHQIPGFVRKLPNLRCLDVSNNPIEKVPLDLITHTNWERLDVRGSTSKRSSATDSI